MGVALDTYDKENGIHPRNKQLTSKRLATAGLNVAYNMREFPSNGPFPLAWNFEPLENGTQISIVYDQEFDWNPTENEGFYVCCNRNTEVCNNLSGNAGGWQRVRLINFETLFFN